MKTVLVMDSLDSLDVVLARCRTLFNQNGVQEITVQNFENSRSVQQNRLSFLWYKYISIELSDGTPAEKRAFCKLHVGVPIRREKESFREVYDRVIRPLTYEQKIELMGEPIDFPITRDMGVKEMTTYLEGVDRLFAEQGVILPKPEDIYYSAMGIKRK